MATIVKTPSGTWKAVIRKQGWPTASKTFRIKRDAEDWSRRAEDEMVRGVYIDRTSAERLIFGKALDRYLSEVTLTKKPSTQAAEKKKAEALRDFFGDYSLAAISPDLIASYRDQRRRRLVPSGKARSGSRSPMLAPSAPIPCASSWR